MRFQLEKYRLLNQMFPHRRIGRRGLQPATPSMLQPQAEGTSSYVPHAPAIYEDVHHHAYSDEAYVPFTPEAHVADMFERPVAPEGVPVDWTNHSAEGGHGFLESPCGEINAAIEEARQQPLEMVMGVETVDESSFDVTEHMLVESSPEPVMDEQSAPEAFGSGPEHVGDDGLPPEPGLMSVEHDPSAPAFADPMVPDSMSMDGAQLDEMVETPGEFGSPLEQTIDDYLMGQDAMVDPLMWSMHPYPPVGHFGLFPGPMGPAGPTPTDDFAPPNPLMPPM